MIVFLQNLARRCVGIGSFRGIFCFQSTVCGRLGGVLCAFALRANFFPKDKVEGAVVLHVGQSPPLLCICTPV